MKSIVLFFIFKNIMGHFILGILMFLFNSIVCITHQDFNGTSEKVSFKKIYGIISSGAILSGYEYQENRQKISGYETPYTLRVYTLNTENEVYFIGICEGVCISGNSNGAVFVSINNSFREYQFSILDKNRYFITEKNKYSNFNRPMALTIEEGKLLLTILDKNGGGSLDGIESVLELQEDGTWEVIRCYDYNNWDIFENSLPKNNNEWYYNGTIQFDSLNLLPLVECKDNVKLER